ncbi:oligosaccharide flippase family protein [Aquimarina longa]|uniref:oligosaccharide flippase family protein n=1 Tax=Aquimarina longa TaxID=1080221 RepID=UPI000785EE69|nr:oligosaccharide flippase family protein [Aquimarina longa]
MKTVVQKIKNFQFSNDLKELIRNSFWSLLGGIISKVTLFIAWVMVAKILGKEGNGQVGIVKSTINMFVLFVGSGIGLTVTKYIPQLLSENLHRINKIISLSFVVSIIVGLFLSSVLFFGAEFLSTTILNSPSLVITLKISAFLLFLNAINGVLSGSLQGFKGFKDLMIINSIYGVVLFGLLYYGALLYGIEGTFLGFVLGTFFQVILSFYFLRKHMHKNTIKFTFAFKEEYRVLKKFTLPAILTGLMVIPFKWLVDTIMVNSDNGYAYLGLYAAIVLFQTLLLMITNTINAPLITIMTKKNSSGSIDRINVVLPWAIGILVSLPILFFSYFFGSIFGKEYVLDDNYRVTLFLVVFTTVVMLYKQGLARIMIVNNLMWFSFLSNMIWGVALLVSFYCFSDKTPKSLAISYLIAYSINTIIVFPIYIKRKIIPIHLIKSTDSFIIWILFITIVVSVYYYPDMSIGLRLISMIGSMLVFSFFFYRLIMIKKKTV